MGFFDFETDKDRAMKEYMGQLQSLYGQRVKDRDNPMNQVKEYDLGQLNKMAIQNIGQAGQIANQNLMGAQERTVGSTVQNLGGQYAKMFGTSGNPFLYANRGRSEVTDQYANQFGNLNTNLAQQLAQALQNNPELEAKFRQMNIGNRMQYNQMLNSLMGQQGQAASMMSDKNFMNTIAPALLGAGGTILGGLL